MLMSKNDVNIFDTIIPSNYYFATYLVKEKIYWLWCTEGVPSVLWIL